MDAEQRDRVPMTAARTRYAWKTPGLDGFILQTRDGFLTVSRLQGNLKAAVWGGSAEVEAAANMQHGLAANKGSEQDDQLAGAHIEQRAHRRRRIHGAAFWSFISGGLRSRASRRRGFSAIYFRAPLFSELITLNTTKLNKPTATGTTSVIAMQGSKSERLAQDRNVQREHQKDERAGHHPPQCNVGRAQPSDTEPDQERFARIRPRLAMINVVKASARALSAP